MPYPRSPWRPGKPPGNHSRFPSFRWPPVRHSFRHAHPDPSGQIVPSRLNIPVDEHLSEREPCGGERERARAPHPHNFWPRGGLGRSRGRHLSHTGHYVITRMPKSHSKGRCAINRYRPAKPGAMLFFSYLSSVTLADSEKNHRKLITFPLTAEKSHLLIFSSPAVRRQRGQERKQGKINIIRNGLRLRDE